MKKFLVGIFLIQSLTAFSQQEKHPSLIPSPTSVQWNKGMVDLNNCKTIFISDTVFHAEANLLQHMLAEKSITTKITAKHPTITSGIFIRRNTSLQEEAYELRAVSNRIEILVSTSHGLFNAIQTLQQLIHNNKVVSCFIQDQPAFALRGYMFDVGRNYQSMALLKQQIDVMAAYKLNAFHMHLTEHLAWRIESKIHPELTHASSMKRDAGKYYTFAELRFLKKYCESKHILFIPEIDMPGHSDAFKRAIGFDMQSPEGKKIVIDILDEFFREINPEYFHIGGDEVSYRDQNFLTDICKHLAVYGKKLIGWDPGGKLPDGVMHQMWNGNKKPLLNEISIDSRHLYLNHLDPLEGVSAVFNHIVLDTTAGNDQKFGAILCNWPDRKLATEMDGVKMNPVYPVMLAFAERTWRGGGFKNFTSDIGTKGDKKYQAFVEFENRLLDHQKTYFSQLPFPYVKQSNVDWTLIGPYQNQGNTNASFEPEQPVFFDTANLKRYQQVFGGTIWLKHFWYPMIGGHLKQPEDSITWYGYRSVYSETDCIKHAWIGFFNISRSNPTPTPPKDAWDYRNSQVWVNGQMIQPPHWTFPGRIPASDEEPLVDEGYEYREPTEIHLKKGWNRILVKAPIKDFSSSWQMQSKWMFTFVLID